MTTTATNVSILPALRRRVESATLSDIMHANVWYGNARTLAERMVNINPAYTVEIAATIIAAFSPRVRWETNVRKALAFTAGMRVRGLRDHTRKAHLAERIGFDAIPFRTAPKTHSFARNIAGDMDAVTVDIWMCRAAEIGRDSPTIRQYRAIADAVRTLAAEYNMTPATMQALIWIVERGRAE
jgi:hypothetical protein